MTFSSFKSAGLLIVLAIHNYYKVINGRAGIVNLRQVEQEP